MAAWSGGVGSGNIHIGSDAQLGAGQVLVSSLVCASGFVIQSAANVGGSAAAIVGRPEGYLQIRVRGQDYLLPYYRIV